MLYDALMIDEETVLVIKQGFRGELVLNRPHRKNALTGPMVDRLHSGLESLIDDPDVRVILLRGSDGVLCAGNDLTEFSSSPSPDWLADHHERWINLHEALFNCPKPIVCALEGVAIAAGSALVLACDLVIAGEKARLHVAEASEKIKKTPHLNTVWLMWRYGPARTLELAMTAIPLYGRELVDRGMAVMTMADEKVLASARQYADQVGQAAPEIISNVKQSIRELSFLDFREAAERASSTQQAGASPWQNTKGLKKE